MSPEVLEDLWARFFKSPLPKMDLTVLRLLWQRIQCQRCFVLDGTFRPDPDFSYEDYIKNAFGIMRTDKVVHVAVQFRGYEARLARERSLHESQRTEEMPDGSVIIHLDVTGLEEVKRWVLSCGKDAKVLEPDWFALELKNEIEEMQKRYI